MREEKEMWYIITFEDSGKFYIDKEVFERKTVRGCYYPLLTYLDKGLTRRWISIVKTENPKL